METTFRRAFVILAKWPTNSQTQKARLACFVEYQHYITTFMGLMDVSRRFRMVLDASDPRSDALLSGYRFEPHSPPKVIKQYEEALTSCKNAQEEHDLFFSTGQRIEKQHAYFRKVAQWMEHNTLVQVPTDEPMLESLRIWSQMCRVGTPLFWRHFWLAQIFIQFINDDEIRKQYHDRHKSIYEHRLDDMWALITSIKVVHILQERCILMYSLLMDVLDYFEKNPKIRPIPVFKIALYSKRIARIQSLMHNASITQGQQRESAMDILGQALSELAKTSIFWEKYPALALLINEALSDLREASGGLPASLLAYEAEVRRGNSLLQASGTGNSLVGNSAAFAQATDREAGPGVALQGNSSNPGGSSYVGQLNRAMASNSIGIRIRNLNVNYSLETVESLCLGARPVKVGLVDQTTASIWFSNATDAREAFNAIKAIDNCETSLKVEYL